MSDTISDSTPPAVSTSGIAQVRGLFRRDVDVVRVRPEPDTKSGHSVLLLSHESLAGLPEPRRAALPVLAMQLGIEAGSVPVGGRSTVLVAVEGRDWKMSREIAALFDPERAMLRLLHVTWLPGTASSPIDEEGIDDPSPSDLLMYDGARDALIQRATELREAGFVVTTHLRLNRRPSAALAAEVERLAPSLIVLGLGRHGAGIGRDLWRAESTPILFVNARD